MGIIIVKNVEERITGISKEMTALQNSK